MLILLTRTLVLYLVVTVCLRLMGKRQMGEMQSSELVITLLISEMAALPMQETELPLLRGMVPILTLVACEILVSFLMMKWRWFRELVCGRPSVLIRNGKIDQREMERVRCTVEDLAETLRLQSVFDLKEVEFAALETNGQLSVMLRGGKTTPKAEDFGISVQNTLFTIVVEDGKFCQHSAALCGRSRAWIAKILKKEHCSQREVFLLAADAQGEYRLVRKEKRERKQKEENG